MLGEDVLLDVEDGIATVTLNQPDRMNALSESIKTGIQDALDEVSNRDDVRVVVLEGAGKAFCAGGDISGMVAKIDGYCVGAGMGVAMSCDVLLASDRAQFGLAFRNIGLTLDYATSLFVTRAVGPYVAKELALTGKTITAEEAEDLGIINHAYPTDEFEAEATDLIEQIATGPTVALHYSVRNIDRSYNSSIQEVVEQEALSQNLASSTRDHQEGIEAFGEDREPSFEGH